MRLRTPWGNHLSVSMDMMALEEKLIFLGLVGHPFERKGEKKDFTGHTCQLLFDKAFLMIQHSATKWSWEDKRAAMTFLEQSCFTEGLLRVLSHCLSCL